MNSNAAAADAPDAEGRPWVHVGLLIATICTTFWAGTGAGTRAAERAAVALSGQPQAPWYADSALVLDGMSFALTILGILGVHELGHWWVARRSRLPASLPYFIPFVPPIGTMGAVIELDTTRASRTQLLRVAVAGPLAGMAVCVPALWLGVSWSEVVVTAQLGDDVAILGDNLLMKLVIGLVHGQLPDGSELLLHPVALAAWAGCFMTALNLIPISQLDGGHISFAVFGARHNRAVHFVAGLLGVWAVLAYWGWLLPLLLAWRIGFKHPPCADDAGDAPPESGWLAAACAVCFVLTFIPRPIITVGTGLLNL